MRCKRVMHLALALGCLLWLATIPALSQAQDARVQMIMSKLPPQASATYRAIRKRAGRATLQVLTLTKTEMWSVPLDRVAAVKRAAARLGVGVNELAADWNHVFRLMPANTSMTGEEKAMMARAMGSKAAIGVSMMMPPRAAMVEYALTKDARGPSKEPARIVLKLNEATALTITRTSVDIKPDMCIWRGTVDGTYAPATIMWWPGVTMTGTVQHEGRIYSLRRMRGGIHAVAVVEMTEARMPPEHAPMPARMRANDPNLRDDPLVQQGDASMLRPNAPIAEKRASMGTTIQSPAKTASEEIIINLIVAYTKKAASNYGDVQRELVDLSIEEANQSFRISNLGQIKLRLVHTYQTDYVEEGEHFNHLWRFADKGDGYMDEIHGLRDKYDADVAVLIVDDPKGCGLSTRVFADADEAFAVVHHECAATTYSVAHEIGHIIGARHDLNIDKTMVPFPYGHGFVNGTKWRDIMSYKESCGGCPRLPVWSSPKVMIRGEPAGTPNADNARVIAEQAARVANFRSSRNKRTYSLAPIPTLPSTGTADQASTLR
jgi:hypothetical protein